MLVILERCLRIRNQQLAPQKFPKCGGFTKKEGNEGEIVSPTDDANFDDILFSPVRDLAAANFADIKSEVSIAAAPTAVPGSNTKNPDADTAFRRPHGFDTLLWPDIAGAGKDGSGRVVSVKFKLNFIDGAGEIEGTKDSRDVLGVLKIYMPKVNVKQLSDVLGVLKIYMPKVNVKQLSESIVHFLTKMAR